MSTRQRWFFFLVVALSLYVLEPLWLPLATGLILAYLCEGPYFRLCEKWKANGPHSRFAVSILFVSLVSSVFFAPLVLLSWSATYELLAFWKDVNGDSSATETYQHVVEWAGRMLNPIIEQTGLNFSVNDITQRFQQGMEPFLKNLAMQFANILSGTPALLLFLTVSTMAWVYFLIHGRDQRRVLLPKLIPWPEQRDVISETLGETLRALVLTSVILSVIQSVLVIGTLGLTGIPKYYLWGALAFFLSFIPVFGTAPVMISAAVYAFMHDKSAAGIIIICMAVFIGSIDNVVRPMLMKGSSELNFFWLFMALVGGVAIFGLAGAVIGPWAFAMFSMIMMKEENNQSSSMG